MMIPSTVRAERTNAFMVDRAGHQVRLTWFIGIVVRKRLV